MFENAKQKFWCSEGTAMMIRVLLIMLALVAVSPSARAFSSSPSQGGWSNLTTERLQQFPSIVRTAIVNAQKSCGEESIGIRSGFIRYLRDAIGDEFIALHFDQFHCANRSTLFTSSGCLHQIFAALDGSTYREVWHDHVKEVDMTNETGRMSASVRCGGEGNHCAMMLRWNGKQLVP
jgi:hypothetical protein